MKVGFAGPFSVRLADRVRRHLNVECEMILADESGVVGLIQETRQQLMENVNPRLALEALLLGLP